jgi:hypothetical protein
MSARSLEADKRPRHTTVRFSGVAGCLSGRSGPGVDGCCHVFVAGGWLAPLLSLLLSPVPSSPVTVLPCAD